MQRETSILAKISCRSPIVKSAPHNCRQEALPAASPQAKAVCAGAPAESWTRKIAPTVSPGADRVHDSLDRGQVELVEPPGAGSAGRRSDARALEQPCRMGTRRHCQPTQLVRGENGERHLGDRLRSLRGDRPMAAAAPAGEAPQLVGVYLQDVNLSRRKCHGNLLVTVKEQQRLTFGEGKLYVELLIDAGRISAAQGQTRDFAARRVCRVRDKSCSTSPDWIGAEGSMSSVASPAAASITVWQQRVSPAETTVIWFTPACSIMWPSRSPFSPPRNCARVTIPGIRWLAARENCWPFPPTDTRTSRARLTCPRSQRSKKNVFCRAGFKPTASN